MPNSKRPARYVPSPHYTREDWDDVGDSPELSQADFARARPLAEAMPDLHAALERPYSGAPRIEPESPLALFVKRVRAARGLTQREFADTYAIALGRLRDWEQGRFKPDAMTISYLSVIEHEPAAVARARDRHKAA